MVENRCHLADNLSGLRKQKHFSQEKVAEAIGVTGAVAELERGGPTPGLIHGNALASLYDVTFDD